MNENKLYEQAIRLWGKKNQLDRAAEELAELVVAIMKVGRKINGITIDSLAEEIVDVEIMLKQIKLIFEKDGIEATISRIRIEKLARLEKLIENDIF